jgi:uncharacterized protein (UPF0335 family)
MDASNYTDPALRGFMEELDVKYDARTDLNGDIGEIYTRIKEAGYEVGMVRALVKEWRMDADARNALYEKQAEYRGKLGMLVGTPLGEAAMPEHLRRTAVAVERPTPFAEQPVHQPRPRGRPRKNAEQALDSARTHLGGSKPMFDA